MNLRPILMTALLMAALDSRAASGSSATGDLRKFAVGTQASSWQRGNDPRFAFDDDPGTRWASAWKDDQWISIDLGQPRAITEIILRWEDAYPSDYRLETSDNGTSWRSLGRVTTSRGGDERHAVTDVSARFVRLVGLRRATQWGISLREFVLRGPLSEPEPELGGSIRPRDVVTLFDHDWQNLSRQFSRQCAQDPPDSRALTDDAFLDLIEKRAFDFFWYEVHPQSLFVVDSTTWKARTSSAAIGFQLAAYIAGHHRSYRDPREIYQRVERLLDHCWDDPEDPRDLHLDHEEGWVYHWVDIRSGEWKGEEHICTHDSIVYLCGVIAARHYFAGTRAAELAGRILEAVNWSWIIHGGRNEKFVSNCYARTYDPPCGGEVRFYDGMKFDYLLPIGGESSSVPPVYWHNYALDFPWDSYRGHFWRIQRPAQWIHQWDHLWFDFRHLQDDYADYHQNSVEALWANRQWCIDNGMYDADLWGLNPCRSPSPDGGSFYGSFGAPPDNLPFQKGTDNNGTITPTATLPSLSFAPAEVLRVARHLYDTYKDRFWLRYGFPDALNPAQSWFDKEYIGIDEGPIIMGIENYRSGLFWRYFGAEPMVWEGLRRAGFAGVVDTFDEMEHSPPYGRWSAGDAGGSFQLERTSGFVKEGRRALRVRYDVATADTQAFFAVQQARQDFSPFGYLKFWLRGAAELEPVLVMADGQLVPLAEEVSRPVAQGWRHCYYSIPSAARGAPVQEVRFVMRKPGQGTCWLDAILLTHEVGNREAEFVLDDFARHRAAWDADPAYQLALLPEAGPADAGVLSLRVPAGHAPPLVVRPTLRDWSRFHSVSLWMKGRATIRLRLADGAGRSHDVDTYSCTNATGWQHVFFNIQANLNPDNCWEPRYDKRDIRQLLIALEPNPTDRADTVLLDALTLTE